MQNDASKVSVKLSYGQLKRRPGTLNKLADVLTFIETCPEMPAYFFLKYKDDEGDMMTVTSEKEFCEALQLCARQKLLSIEVVAANEKDAAVLKKGEKLPAEDEEPFQIVVPEPGAEVKDQKKEDTKQPVEANPAPKTAEVPKEAPKANSFIAAMDKTVTPTPQKKELTPLEQLDALLATIVKDANTAHAFRLTRASFIQELGVVQNPPAAVAVVEKEKEKEKPQVLNDSKASPVPTPNPEAKKETPKKEAKRGSQSDSTKPKLLRPNSKYAQQIEELAAMGFKVDAVEQALERYRGNTQKALNVLVTESS